jgi:hypothetical protein
VGRKASGVREAVENGLSLGIRLEKKSIRSLIEKETRLLTTPHIYTETDSMFLKFDQLGRLLAHKKTCGAIVQPVGPSSSNVTALVDALRVDDLRERVDNGGPQMLHPHGVKLHHQKTGVPVDDQSWQAIRFPVYDAVGVRLRKSRIFESQAVSPFDGSGQEGVVDGFVAVPGHQANRNGGMGIVIPPADEATF